MNKKFTKDTYIKNRTSGNKKKLLKKYTVQ